MVRRPPEQIGASFLSVLETFGFMFGEPAEARAIPPCPSGWLASLRIAAEAATIQVVLAVPLEFCPMLAANALGLDSAEAPDAQRLGQDALKELANVFCAQLATQLFGTHVTFDSAIPVMRPLSAGEWDGLKNQPQVLAFMVDGMPALVRLDVREHS